MDVLSRIPEISGAAATAGKSRALILEGALRGRAAVRGRQMLILGSNDYLGLASHPHVLSRARAALEEYGAGTGMNPVVGTTRVHEDLIEILREFTGCEDVLLASSCTAANCALIPALLGPEDVAISDELNHASIIDACRLSRRQTIVYRHGNVDDLQRALVDSRSARLRLVITDGVFSMEGVAAPLPEILRATEEGNAVLAVDESHAAGVLGATGRGTRELFGIPAGASIQTGTLSKAFGAGNGGYVAGSRDLIAHLRARARFFIFTSGIAPATAGAALGAVEVLLREPELLTRLQSNASRLRRGLREMDFDVLGDSGPIVPLIAGDKVRADTLSARLLENGIYVPAFSYPIVAEGSARLRFQVSAAHSSEDIDFVLTTLDRLRR